MAAISFYCLKKRLKNYKQTNLWFAVGITFIPMLICWCSCWWVWDYISELQPPTGHRSSSRWYMSMENRGGMILTEESRRTRRKTYTNATSVDMLLWGIMSVCVYTSRKCVIGTCVRMLFMGTTIHVTVRWSGGPFFLCLSGFTTCCPI
jgi:hypothetical protein